MEHISTEIERKTLAYIFQIGRQAMMIANRYIDESDFRNLQHRLIYSCICGATGEDAFSDASSLIHWIGKNRDWLNGHFKRLSPKDNENEARSKMVDKIIEISQIDIEPSFDLIKSCQIIFETSLRDGLIRKHVEIIHSLKDGADVFDAVDQTYKFAVDSYTKFENIQPFSTIKVATDEFIKQLEREKNGEIVRLPTGFDLLDGVIKGFENGKLYVLGAEEKIGKSIFISQSAFSIANKNIPVGILSLEMKRTELAKRYLSMFTGVDTINRLDIPRVKEQSKIISDLPIFIFDMTLNTKQLAQKTQSLVIERKVKIIFVDYLQLVEAGGKSYTKTDEINQTVRTLKRLAMDLNVPIVLIASLTIKSIYSRSDRKPRASDFRDSGQIPYDADVIMFLWKPDPKNDNYRELFIERSRYSRTGDPLPLLFDNEKLMFRPTTKRAVQNNTNLSYFTS